MKTLRYKTEVLSCVAHFLVDLTCTACLGRLSSRLSYDSIIACAILYNALAFAFQLPIGALADFLGITRILAAGGCLLVALGALFPQPLPLCLLIGLGNACFHVGAGREALQLGGAAPVGRFVAPGALGIFFGPRLAGFPLLRLLLPMLLVLSGLSLLPRQKERTAAAAGSCRFPLPAALCMFLTVLLRSYIGTVLRYPLLSGFGWALGFSLCIFGGKFLGGILADRFGFFRSSLCTQTAATVLLTLSLFYPPLALPGILFFNTTMAVTAAALHRSFPRFPGTMFGLTTLALFLGVLPRLLGWENPLFTWWGVGLLCLVSTALFLGGLILTERGNHRAALSCSVAASDAGA